MEENEEWKPIEEAPNYEISNFERVRLSVGRQVKDGGRVLSAHIHAGYPTVNLFIDGTYRKRRIDQLVAKTFYGTTIPEKPRGRPKERRFIMDRETFEPIEEIF